MIISWKLLFFRTHPFEIIPNNLRKFIVVYLSPRTLEIVFFFLYLTAANKSDRSAIVTVNNATRFIDVVLGTYKKNVGSHDETASISGRNEFRSYGAVVEHFHLTLSTFTQSCVASGAIVATSITEMRIFI